MEAGHRIEAWTLEWDEESGILRKMRSKETEADYRYFREPDLLSLQIDDSWKTAVLSTLPELPLQRRARFAQQYGLPIYDADILTSERSLSEYFEATLQAYSGDPKRISNWIINDLMRMINELGIIAADLKVTPAYLAQIIRMVDENTINISTGKALLDKVQNSGKDPAAIVAEEGLAKLSDADALEAMIQKLVAENPQQVENYRKGKTGLLGWFVGQVMKQTQGKADAQLTRSILEKYLNP